MKSIFLAVLLGVFFWLAFSTWGADGGFRVVYPPDRSVVGWEKIRLVGLVSDLSIKSVVCQVKGGEVLEKPVIPVAKGAFSVSVRLRKGLNEISISSQTGANSQKISIYFSKEEGRPPEGFRPHFNHFPLDGEERCENCHALKGEHPNYQMMIPSATCTSAQCHSQIGKGKFVHGPVGAATCIACHNPHGSQSKRMVTRPGGEGCYICHEEKRGEFKGKVIHLPVSEGECMECHDPHQSDQKFQIKGSSQKDLCFNCHDTKLIKQSNLHTPVRVGDCTTCHHAHSSANERLLTAPFEKICFSCHEDAQKGLMKKYVHRPVRENCQNCHDPHSSSEKAQLRKAAVGLCMDCHKTLHPNILRGIGEAKFPHQPVKRSDCSSCHGVHFTDYEKLLKAPLKEICFTCHKELGEKVETNKFPHGPVTENDCAACHETHGSPNPKILRNYFPAEFYVPYKTENYAICFDCHSKEIALDAKTLELTDFRNGDHNLHFLHVNKERKGRSCKACHEVHAGSQAKHIREQVPYGKMWSYPIHYSKTPTGGTCVVGCHKPLSYDRKSPMKY